MLKPTKTHTLKSSGLKRGFASPSSSLFSTPSALTKWRCNDQAGIAKTDVLAWFSRTQNCTLGSSFVIFVGVWPFETVELRPWNRKYAAGFRSEARHVAVTFNVNWHGEDMLKADDSALVHFWSSCHCTFRPSWMTWLNLKINFGMRTNTLKKVTLKKSVIWPQQ